MSHIVSIATRVRDPVALTAACRRLGLVEPIVGTVMLFAAEASGCIVQLPGWTYPVVIDTASGEVRYDNYGGAWGDQAHLDRLLQAYAAEKAKLEARRAGHSVIEQPLPDGSIKLTIQVGGGA
ncbi:MAG: hypothetical protein WBD40_22080 [Tepidisphaeraceae bacterium]